LSVMSIRKLIKKDARLALKSAFSKAASITLTLAAVGIFFYLLESLLYYILDIRPVAEMVAELPFPVTALPEIPLLGLAVSGGCLLLSFLLLSPLNLGAVKWYYELSSGGEASFELLFTYFSSFKLYCRALWYAINLSVRSFFWTLLFLLPGSFCLAAASWLYSVENIPLYLSVVSLLMVIGVFLLAFGCVFAFIYLQKYYVASYLICQDNTVPAIQCFKTSCRYSRGSRGFIALFRLSFLLWYLLCVFIFPVLYVIPYTEASYAIYAKYLIQKGNLERFKSF